MWDTLKFFGLMMAISASLMVGTALVVDRVFDPPAWVKWVLMPSTMLVYSVPAVYISDWLLAARGAGKSTENLEEVQEKEAC
ncbi:MAG: hypothetical protein V3R87_00370 [Dehalococcoidia bacterium]